MAKRADVSWLDVLQHLGQVIAASVALIYAVQRLRRDFRQSAGQATMDTN
jgi:flagellar biogenesis protein FliO